MTTSGSIDRTEAQEDAYFMRLATHHTNIQGPNRRAEAALPRFSQQQQRQTIAGENAVGPKFPVHPSLAETGACQPFGTPPANATVGNRHRAFIDFQRNRTACVWGF